MHADLICSVIRDTKILPVTIGVFGDWGGGKTSIMKMLERNLDLDTYLESTPEREYSESVDVVYFSSKATTTPKPRSSPPCCFRSGTTSALALRSGVHQERCQKKPREDVNQDDGGSSRKRQRRI